MKTLLLVLMLCTSAFGARFKMTAHHRVHAKGLKRGRLMLPFRVEAPNVAAIPDGFDLRGKISPILDSRRMRRLLRLRNDVFFIRCPDASRSSQGNALASILRRLLRK